MLVNRMFWIYLLIGLQCTACQQEARFKIYWWLTWKYLHKIKNTGSHRFPDSKVHGAKMGPCWPQMGPMLAPWILLSGLCCPTPWLLYLHHSPCCHLHNRHLAKIVPLYVRGNWQNISPITSLNELSEYIPKRLKCSWVISSVWNSVKKVVGPHGLNLKS